MLGSSLADSSIEVLGTERLEITIEDWVVAGSGLERVVCISPNNPGTAFYGQA